MTSTNWSTSVPGHPNNNRWQPKEGNPTIQAVHGNLCAPSQTMPSHPVRSMNSLSPVLPSNAELSPTSNTHAHGQAVQNTKQSNSSILIMHGLPTHIPPGNSVCNDTARWPGILSSGLWTRSSTNITDSETHASTHYCGHNIFHNAATFPAINQIHHTHIGMN